MELKEIIYKRKSSRSYLDEKIDDDTLNEIKDFCMNAKRLYPDIPVQYEILTNDYVRTLQWKAPYYIAIFSKKNDEAFANVGFIFQQVDLYLQSRNLGSCWVGLASFNNKHNDIQVDDELEFIIVLAFGRCDNPHRSIDEFNRKSLNEISDVEDEKLKAIQYSPSATNSQPWYITHTSDGYDLYRKIPNIIKRTTIGYMNKIDMGIALANIYIENEDSFEYYRNDNHKKIKKCEYLGSFKI